MKKLLSIALVLILALASCSALAEGAVLTVQGAGYVSLNSDTASVTLGVRKFAKDVKTAQQAVNLTMDNLVEGLLAVGVDKKDMSTSTIYIYPEYDYNYEEGEEEAIRGYSAVNSLTIVTADIDSVGALIDAAFDSGANSLDDVSFSASDTQEASNEALRLAIENAREKAEVMAEAAGAKLGGLLSLQEQDGYYYGASIPYAKNGLATEDAGASTQVFAAKQQVTATVTMQFELLEK